MKIRLNNIIPTPFSDGNFSDESLWGKDITIESHQKVLVQAVSGRGKSTFVNTLYGIRKDFTGEIYLNDRLTTSFSDDDWSDIRTTKMSVVFQDLQLIPHLSLSENLKLKSSLSNTISEEQQKEMIEKVGLIEKWDTPVGILSYGQQQRVAIIRALLQPFEIILLDEPFAHLDRENSAICYQLIEDEARKNKASIILTTLNHTDIDNFEQHLTL